MVGHGGSRAGSYLTDPTSPSPPIVHQLSTSTLRVNMQVNGHNDCCKRYQVLSLSSFVFCKYVVDILKIETVFFTNKWIQVLRIRSCDCCGYAFSL